MRNRICRQDSTQVPNMQTSTHKHCQTQGLSLILNDAHVNLRYHGEKSQLPLYQCMDMINLAAY